MKLFDCKENSFLMYFVIHFNLFVYHFFVFVIIFGIFGTIIYQ
jgi:hypothetical protein